MVVTVFGQVITFGSKLDFFFSSGAKSLTILLHVPARFILYTLGFTFWDFPGDSNELLSEVTRTNYSRYFFPRALW